MDSEPKIYSVLFAEDVPHYGSIEIEAADDAAAIEAAKAFNVRDVTDDPDWSSTVCVRIVHIEDEAGNIIAHDLPLDDFHLRSGGDEDRRLCGAAPALRDALTRIAAIPLWGESIPPGDLRDDYAATDQYDLEDDEFNPSGDTECELLRDAVEEARAALALLKAGQS